VIELLFAAVHESVIGTSRHFVAPQNLSVIGVTADKYEMGSEGKKEILSRLFRSARAAQGVRLKPLHALTRRSGPSGDNPIAERV
jgi:hypothetical protein